MSNPNDTEKIVDVCQDEKLCAYEISIEMAKKSEILERSTVRSTLVMGLGDSFLASAGSMLEMELS